MNYLRIAILFFVLMPSGHIQGQVVDVTLEKAMDNQSTYKPGGFGAYRLIASNTGPDDAFEVRIFDKLPRGISLQDLWRCDPWLKPGDGRASCVAGARAGTPAQGKGLDREGRTEIDLLVDLPSRSSLVLTIPVTFSSNPDDY